MKEKIKPLLSRICLRIATYKYLLKNIFLPWPYISVLMPVYNTKPQVLQHAIESVLSQTYFKWQLCIVDDGSTDQAVIDVLKKYSRKSLRIKVLLKNKNEGICTTLNQAARMARGNYIGVLDHDDELAPETLFEYSRLIVKHPDADCIYCDEDKIDENGKYCDAWYKSDWNPDLSLSFNYVMHFAVYRKSLYHKMGGVRKRCEGSQDYDLLLRCSEVTDKIYHISKILYHWRKSEASTALKPEAKPQIFEQGLWALNDALKRRGIQGTAVHAENAWLGVYKVNRKIVKKLSCSILVNYRGCSKGLYRLLDSIENNFDVSVYEIIICSDSGKTMQDLTFIDTYKNIKIVQTNGSVSVPKAYNTAAKLATGDVLFFLDDSIELVSQESCTCLLEHVQRKRIGAVGGKVYYKNKLVEHAGIIFGPFNMMGFAHRATPDDPGYMGLKSMITNYSAVMGTGMMTRRSVFNQAKGFNEAFKKAYWDADYCLRLRNKNYNVTYTPYAKFIHHIPVTPLEQMIVEPEATYFRELWQHVIDDDPFFNENFSRHLEDFSLRRNL